MSVQELLANIKQIPCFYMCKYLTPAPVFVLLDFGWLVVFLCVFLLFCLNLKEREHKVGQVGSKVVRVCGELGEGKTLPKYCIKFVLI